jgi:desulfoferrodoxin (superoxide reductase-like protein)
MKSKYIVAGVLYILLLTVCLFAPQQAMAHPPEDLVLSYDVPGQTLTVTITHPSTFTGLHYIKQVTVKKNNEPSVKNDYKSQVGKTSVTYTYPIPAADNDVLEVTATCNIQGSKTATLKVEPKKN